MNSEKVRGGADCVNPGPPAGLAHQKPIPLHSLKVTPALLLETGAGKRIRKLAKSAPPDVAAAAAAVVAAWRAAVEGGEGGAARAGTATAAKRPAPSPPPPAAAAEKRSRPSHQGERDTRPSTISQPPTAPEPPGEAGPPPPPSGDPGRDHARSLLAAALALVPASARLPYRPPPGAVAAEVETAVHAWAQAGGGDATARAARCKTKLRSLVFNLKDAANPDTRARVLSGALAPAALVTAAPEELASDARKEENDRIRREALFEAERGQVRKIEGEKWRGKLGWLGGSCVGGWGVASRASSAHNSGVPVCHALCVRLRVVVG